MLQNWRKPVAVTENHDTGQFISVAGYNLITMILCVSHYRFKYASSLCGNARCRKEDLHVDDSDF